MAVSTDYSWKLPGRNLHILAYWFHSWEISGDSLTYNATHLLTIPSWHGMAKIWNQVLWNNSLAEIVAQWLNQFLHDISCKINKITSVYWHLWNFHIPWRSSSSTHTALVVSKADHRDFCTPRAEDSDWRFLGPKPTGYANILPPFSDQSEKAHTWSHGQITCFYMLFGITYHYSIYDLV